MTIPSAIAVLSHADHDPVEVVRALCQLATISHLAGHQVVRDDTIDIAAEMINEFGRRLEWRKSVQPA